MSVTDTDIPPNTPLQVVVFTATNNHTENCGPPPDWLTTPWAKGERRAYFQNCHGEQWIASCTKDLFRITGGDIGWETREVRIPCYENPQYMFRALELVFNGPEAQWLVAVWAAQQ